MAIIKDIKCSYNCFVCGRLVIEVVDNSDKECILYDCDCVKLVSKERWEEIKEQNKEKK